MLAEALEPISTKKGMIVIGQLIEIPDRIAVKLAGKIRLILPDGITLADLAAEFGHDPDWERLKDDPQWIRFMADVLHQRRFRERGEVPPSYTAVRNCRNCGPVWLEPWTPKDVIGCIWCLNREKGLPIPRPQ